MSSNDEHDQAVRRAAEWQRQTKEQLCSSPVAWWLVGLVMGVGLALMLGAAWWFVQ